jgi:hypothetical protein
VQAAKPCAPRWRRRFLDHITHNFHEAVNGPASRYADIDRFWNFDSPTGNAIIVNTGARRREGRTVDEHVADCIMRLWTTASECHR